MIIKDIIANKDLVADLRRARDYREFFDKNESCQAEYYLVSLKSELEKKYGENSEEFVVIRYVIRTLLDLEFITKDRD